MLYELLDIRMEYIIAEFDYRIQNVYFSLHVLIFNIIWNIAWGFQKTCFKYIVDNLSILIEVRDEIYIYI